MTHLNLIKDIFKFPVLRSKIIKITIGSIFKVFQHHEGCSIISKNNICVSLYSNYPNYWKQASTFIRYQSHYNKYLQEKNHKNPLSRAQIKAFDHLSMKTFFSFAISE